MIAHATKELSDRAVAVVLRIRTHETEISTCQMEAMLRDRGAVDERESGWMSLLVDWNKGKREAVQ